MGFLLFWIILGTVVTLIAHFQGKNTLKWAIHGFVTFPILITLWIVLTASFNPLFAMLLVILGIIIALIARFKGRDGLLWFIYGFLIFPVALVHILNISPTAKGIARKAQAEGRQPCPFCAELIMAQAKICPHCQRELEAG